MEEDRDTAVSGLTVEKGMSKRNELKDEIRRLQTEGSIRDGKSISRAAKIAGRRYAYAELIADQMAARSRETIDAH